MALLSSKPKRSRQHTRQVATTRPPTVAVLVQDQILALHSWPRNSEHSLCASCTVQSTDVQRRARPATSHAICPKLRTRSRQHGRARRGAAPCAPASARRGSSRNPAAPPRPCRRSAGTGTAARRARPCAPQGPAQTTHALGTADAAVLADLVNMLCLPQVSTVHIAVCCTWMTTAVTDKSVQKYVPVLRQDGTLSSVSQSFRSSDGCRSREVTAGEDKHRLQTAPLCILLRKLAHHLQTLRLLLLCPCL